MSFNEQDLRYAFGRFATGVCVITINTAGAGPIGVTVNSFSSLSLDPPLILWSMKKTADCCPLYQAAETFTVNILAGHQQDVSIRYSNKIKHTLEADSYSSGVTGAPVLKEFLTALECRVTTTVDGGDHVIFLGQVMEIINRPGNPLVFYQGEYCVLQE